MSTQLLDFNSPRESQPKDILIPLKEHQLALLHKCKTTESKGKFGVMTDKPGSGKTAVLLSLIKSKHIAYSTNLLIVPHNIYYQWLDAIKNFFGNKISYVKYTEYSDVIDLYHRPVLPTVDLIITVPLYYNVLADALNSGRKTVGRVIIDEIDSIEFMFQTYIKYQMLWMISASFNPESSIYSRIFSVRKEHIYASICKCDDSFVVSCFPLPEPTNTQLICQNIYIDTMLYGLLTIDEYNAINALDFSKMKNQFVTMIAKNEKELVDLMVKEYKESISHHTQQLTDLEQSLQNSKGDDTKCLQLTALKNEISDKLKAQEYKLDCVVKRMNDSNMCLICYDDITKKTITTCCKNPFCNDCIMQWLENHTSCPYCRNKSVSLIELETSSPDDVPANDDSIVTTEQPPKNLTKLETLKKLFETDAVGNSVIIFSDYSRIFKEIKDLLYKTGIEYCELDGGNMDTIERDVQKYKKGHVRVLMSNSSMYGCGMNLENTTDIIFMHKPKQEMYQQVVGRAQRPGRIGTLKIWELLHENEQYAGM